MEKRTWPYGTVLECEIVEARTGRHNGEKIRILFAQVQNENKLELHVLLGTGGDSAIAKVGDRGIITFMAGGPTGGYWQFTKQHP